MNLWITFCISLLVLESVSSTDLTDDQISQLESFLETLIECRDNSGISIALVRDGATVYANGFGLRDRELHKQMEADTLINIGSLSKAFTATLAADVVGRGLASWDTPLRDILGPEFGMEGELRTAEVSLKDLLAHKVGVPSYWGVSTAAINVTREELCMNRFRYFPVRYDFRSRYYYANYPYVLTGYVTEVLSGSPWEQHIRQTLFEPLDMSHSKVSAELTESDWDNLAYSYTHTDGGYDVNPEKDQLIFLTEIGPAAAVFSSAIDMGKWMQFHLNEGKTPDGTQVVPLSALRETYSPISALGRESPKIGRPRFPVEDSRLAYGMGWNVGTYRGYDKIYHTGSYSSYNCRLNLLPEVNIGAWACVNSPGDGRGSRAVQLATTFALDILLDQEPWLNDTTACTFPEPWQASTINLRDLSHVNNMEDAKQNSTQRLSNRIPTKNELETYTGEFGHKAFGIFSIFYDSENENQLRYTFGRLLNGEVNPSEIEDVFFMTLGYPISYRMAFFPNDPNGFEIYFIWNTEHTEVTSVRVPYLEFGYPPTFVRGVQPDLK